MSWVNDNKELRHSNPEAYSVAYVEMVARRRQEEIDAADTPKLLRMILRRLDGLK